MRISKYPVIMCKPKQASNHAECIQIVKAFDIDEKCFSITTVIALRSLLKLT